MMSIEAMKQALEALEGYVDVVVSVNDPNDWRTVADGGKPAREAITSLRQAISEAEKQEPVVWMYQDKSTHEVRFQKHMRDFVDHGAWYEVPLYSEPLANQEKTSGSPIKELNCICGAVWEGEELVHTPPHRKPLTDEEIAKIASTPCAVVGSYVHTFARAIEAAHGIKEKNT